MQAVVRFVPAFSSKLPDDAQHSPGLLLTLKVVSSVSVGSCGRRPVKALEASVMLVAVYSRPSAHGAVPFSCRPASCSELSPPSRNGAMVPPHSEHVTPLQPRP